MTIREWSDRFPGHNVGILTGMSSGPIVLDVDPRNGGDASLAKLVADYMGTDIAFLSNPRCEPDENDLIVRNDQFLALGLQPTTLSEGLLEEGREIAVRYRHRVDPTKIVCRSVWRAGMEKTDDLLTEFPVL